MNDKEQLAAAKECVRARLKGIYPWVFDRHKGSPADLSKQEYWVTRSIDAPRPKKLTVAARKRLSDSARGGDASASCALLDAAIDCLDRGVTLPGVVKDYAIVSLQRNRIAISQKQGRKIATNFTRDWLIASWVAEMRRFGFKPTRNQEQTKKQTDSGCSIVANILAELGTNLPEAAVAKIWQQLSKDKQFAERFIEPPVRN